MECCIKIALSEKPDIEPKWNKGSAIRYFQQHAGVVKSIEGVEDAEKVSGVQQISFVHGVGEEVTEVTSSGARMGFVIAQDEYVEKAVADCYESLGKIEVDIE